MAIQALILAAGRGSRLGEIQGGIPKPLLQVGRKTLINHMLDALSDAGVGPVTMVLGYSADEIREAVGLQADYIINPYWETTNSLYSFSLAKEKIKGPLMILNCDLMLHPKIIEKLLSSGEDSIAYDSTSGDSREQMAVKLRGGFVQDMSKELNTKDVHGENVGILYFSQESTELLFEEADKILEKSGKKDWIGSAVKKLAQKRDIKGVDIAGLPWAEIDFPTDLERARTEVWPSIEESKKPNRPFWQYVLWAVPLVGVFLLWFFLRNDPEPLPKLNWDTVDLAGGEKVKLHFDVGAASWWAIDVGDSVVADEVIGPGIIRIESRPIISTKTGKKLPYVVEVSINGIRENWYKSTFNKSNSATHPNWIVGKRNRIELDLPEGENTVGVKLIAAESVACLVRVRQVDEDLD